MRKHKLGEYLLKHYPLKESEWHSGESRAERIRKFHAKPQNRQQVLALYESSMLLLKDNQLNLLGSAASDEPAAWLFRQGQPEPVAYEVGSDWSGLLG